MSSDVFTTHCLGIRARAWQGVVGMRWVSARVLDVSVDSLVNITLYPHYHISSVSLDRMTLPFTTDACGSNGGGVLKRDFSPSRLGHLISNEQHQMPLLPLQPHDSTPATLLNRRWLVRLLYSPHVTVYGEKDLAKWTNYTLMSWRRACQSFKWGLPGTHYSLVSFLWHSQTD